MSEFDFLNQMSFQNSMNDFSHLQFDHTNMHNDFAQQQFDEENRQFMQRKLSRDSQNCSRRPSSAHYDSLQYFGERIENASADSFSRVCLWIFLAVFAAFVVMMTILLISLMVAMS